MKKFLSKLLTFYKFILVFFLLGLSFASKTEVVAVSNVCSGSNTQLSLDVNPKSGPATQFFTVSGSVTLINLYNGNSLYGCFYEDGGSIVRNFVVSVYDKNSKQKLLSDFTVNLTDFSGPSTQKLNFPSLTFKPSQSFVAASPPDNLQLVASVKVFDVNNITRSFILTDTESAPVQLALTPVSGGGTAGDFCTTADSSDCTEGFYCDISASKTCKPSVAGTDCSQDSTICAAPLTCVSNKCAAPAGTKEGTPPPGPAVLPGDSTVVIKPLICDPNNPDPTHCNYNPLPVNNLKDALLVFLKSFMELMGVTTVAFIIFGGYKLTISSGNEEMRTSAKKTITWAIVGFVIAMLAFSIITIVQDLLGKTVS